MAQSSGDFFEWEKTWYPKFIVTGEHSVLRGAPAIVFPYKNKRLYLRARLSKKKSPTDQQNQSVATAAGSSPLPAELLGPLATSDCAEWKMQSIRIKSFGENAADIPMLVHGLWQESLRHLGINAYSIGGELEIHNEVPLGSGLGSSALFCSLISQLLVQLNMLPKEQSFPFARKLEHHFHGQSSGVDVAGVFAGAPIVYSIREGLRFLQVNNKLVFSVHSSGQKGITKQAIEQVQALKDKDPSQFQKAENLMHASVQTAIQALEEGDADRLVTAIQKGREAFETWGLITPSMHKLMQDLLQNGALAVKPTGSGLGGYILALWSPEVWQKSQYEISCRL